LIASLGAGGKNVIGLDITNASATTAPKLLFSFDTSNQPKLGHVMGKPFIAPMKNGRFAAIFGNGYEGTSLTTSLFVVDLQDPTSLTNTRVIDAVALPSTGNGLSTPALLPDIMGRVEYAYAGDLLGNMWRFDLTSTSPASWSSMKIFTAKDNSSNAQPIFAAPTLGFNGLRANKVMVYFGTGKYFEDTDSALGTTVNSFYAVLDEQAAYTRANLKQKAINETAGKRTLQDDNATLWSTITNKGWYMDFATSTGGATGERITVKPLLIFDRLIFPTLKPSTDPCGFGGTSWLMEAVAVGDKADTNPMLSEMIQSDYLVLGELAFGIVPTLDDTGQIIISTSQGTVKPQTVNIKSGIGRVNWRQLD
jgi:type IV pilus assembly protein PilY1